MSRSNLRNTQGTTGDEEITSTYRAMYGGPTGSSLNSWKSSMSPQLSPKAGTPDLSRGSGFLEQGVEVEQPNLAGLVEDLRISDMPKDERNSERGDALGGFLTPIRDGALSREGEGGPEIRDTVSAAMREISILTTGNVTSQREAMVSLVDSIKQSSSENRQAIHNAGGTHILHTNISSSDREVRILCTEGLVAMMEERRAMEELLSSKENSSRVVGAAVRELILSGDISSQRLLAKMVSFPLEGQVEVCCAEHKVVSKLLEKVEEDFQSQPGEESNALELLQSMVESGREYFLNTAVWNGALTTLIALLCSERIKGKEQILRVVWTVCSGQRDAVQMLCTPDTIKGLSSMLADPSYSMEIQLKVCLLLYKICATQRKRRDIKIALQDYCLPRVSELIHQSKSESLKYTSTGRQQESIESSEQRVWATCAAIVSLLARESSLCCHIIFQADVLLHSVRLLIESCQYRLCKELLDATANYAKCS